MKSQAFPWTSQPMRKKIYKDIYLYWLIFEWVNPATLVFARDCGELFLVDEGNPSILVHPTIQLPLCEAEG